MNMTYIGLFGALGLEPIESKSSEKQGLGFRASIVFTIVDPGNLAPLSNVLRLPVLGLHRAWQDVLRPR